MASASNNIGDIGETAFPPEVIGMLIVNELKCLRKEVVEEVKRIGEKLETLLQLKLMPENHRDVDNNHRNIFFNEPELSDIPVKIPSRMREDSENGNKQTDVGGFKEVDSFNLLMRKHVAFQMSPSPSKREHLLNSSNNIEINFGGESQPDGFITTAEASRDISSSNLSKETEEEDDVRVSNIRSLSSPNRFHNKSSEFRNTHKNEKDVWNDKTVAFFYANKQLKKFKCSICSKEFSTKGSLLRHNQLHSGIRRFVCKICGKAFFRSDHLKTHMPTHTREKPYYCPICQKYFSRLQNLQKHVKLHGHPSNVMQSISSQPSIEYFPPISPNAAVKFSKQSVL